MLLIIDEHSNQMLQWDITSSHLTALTTSRQSSSLPFVLTIRISISPFPFIYLQPIHRFFFYVLIMFLVIYDHPCISSSPAVGHSVNLLICLCFYLSTPTIFSLQLSVYLYIYRSILLHICVYVSRSINSKIPFKVFVYVLVSQSR